MENWALPLIFKLLTSSLLIWYVNAGTFCDPQPYYDMDFNFWKCEGSKASFDEDTYQDVSKIITCNGCHIQPKNNGVV